MIVLIPDAPLTRLRALPLGSADLLVVVVPNLVEAGTLLEEIHRLGYAALAEGGELIVATSLSAAFAAL